jgi:hypothetical protein
MADATITNTTYGYNAKTGTDKTVVTTNECKLLGINLVGTAGSETVLVTDYAENVLLRGIATTANKSEWIPFYGSRVKGLKVTLSASTVQANFFI